MTQNAAEQGWGQFQRWCWHPSSRRTGFSQCILLPYSSALIGVPWQKGYPESTLPLPSAGGKGILSSSFQDLESQAGQWATPVGLEARRDLQVTGISEMVGGHFKSLALFPNMETLTSAPSSRWSYSLSRRHLDPNTGLNLHSSSYP